jgi:spore maturation protein CgeB
MHIVIFGLTISSSWGNGHATLWRSLVKAMLRRGHSVIFYERDTPYYADTRDLEQLPRGGVLRLYSSLDDILERAQQDLRDADLAICTSYCPDGRQACELILASSVPIRCFYDLDTPVTLHSVRAGKVIDYLPPNGLGEFDLVLSYTGGRALEELQQHLGARLIAPLYGSVDPENHKLAMPSPDFQCCLSYLGTYAADRQQALERLFIDPASLLPDERFLIGGSLFPPEFRRSDNIFQIEHVPPPMHPVFFSSCRATLNVTRSAMAQYGFCPSGRLFEAAACGAPILTDTWEGLDSFFTSGAEVVSVQCAEDVINALSLSDAELLSIACAGRERTLSEHTGDCRVLELERICSSLRDLASQPA